MVSQLFFYQLVLVALVWLCVMLQWAWPSDPAPVWPRMSEAVTSGNGALGLIYSHTCERQCITPKACATTSHNTDRVAQ